MMLDILIGIAIADGLMLAAIDGFIIGNFMKGKFCRRYGPILTPMQRKELNEMKIVGVDNLARETVADQLWLEEIPDNDECKKLAQRVCDKLNERLGDDEGTHFTIKPNGYRLSRGMEDLV